MRTSDLATQRTESLLKANIKSYMPFINFRPPKLRRKNAEKHVNVNTVDPIFNFTSTLYVRFYCQISPVISMQTESKLKTITVRNGILIIYLLF